MYAVALEKRKRARRLVALGLTVVAAIVVVFWALAVFADGRFLWLDGRLAWVFTLRWAALLALIVVVLPAVIAHLCIRSAPGAPERPAAAELAPAAEPEAAAERVLEFRRAGLKGLVVGADGRSSTSQVQAVLWLIALLFGLVFLLILGRSPNCPLAPDVASAIGSCARVPGGISFPGTLGEDFPWEYLLLLGWPLAVAIAARKQVLDGLRKLRDRGAKDVAVSADAAQAGTPEAAGTPGNVRVDGKITPVAAKSPPTTADGLGYMAGVRDLLCNDRGHGSIMDVQVLGFTLVTIGYFLIEVLSHPERGLPQIPAALLVLMGISGGGYLTAKAIDPLGTAGAAAPLDEANRPDPAAAVTAVTAVTAERDQARRELQTITQRAEAAERDRDALIAAGRGRRSVRPRSGG